MANVHKDFHGALSYGIQFIIDEYGKIVTAIEDAEVPPPPPAKEVEGETPPPPAPEKVVMEGIVVAGYRNLDGDEKEHAVEYIQLLADEAVRVVMESKIEWTPAKKEKDCASPVSR